MKYYIIVFILVMMQIAILSQGGDDIVSMPDPSLVDDMLQRIANYRDRYGLPPYVLNEQLTHAAQDQADWLVATGMRTHFRPGGIGPSRRAKAFGYDPIGWCCGENYYLSIDATPDMVWDFWVWSPSHRINLLHSTFQEVGVGMATNGTRHSYVLIFGNSIGEPAETEEPTAQPEQIISDDGCNRVHIIQSGETLSQIGQRYGVSVNQLAAQNHIEDVSMIYAGQRLCISGNSHAQIISDDTAPLILDDDNWCYSGNRWGDGRCSHPDNPVYEQLMWECGWYQAHGKYHPNCGG